LSAEKFFLGPMVTALPPMALLIAARFPVWPEQRIGVGFHEINARQSDFAFVSAAAQVALDQHSRCTRADIGIGAATAVPLRLDAVAKMLEGKALDEHAVRQALDAALADVDTITDLHVSADYRRRVAVTLAARAIADAFRGAQSLRDANAR
jgi:CO/xanthine dehydrogenase FAD-binding subunit